MANFKVGSPTKSYNKWYDVQQPSGGQIIDSKGKIYNIQVVKARPYTAVEKFFRKLLHDVAVVVTLGQARNWKKIKDLKCQTKEVYFVSRDPTDTPRKIPVYIISMNYFSRRESDVLEKFYSPKLYDLETVIVDEFGGCTHDLNLLTKSDPSAPKSIVSVVHRPRTQELYEDQYYHEELRDQLKSLSESDSIFERHYYVGFDKAKEDQRRSVPSGWEGDHFFIDANDRVCRPLVKTDMLFL